MAETQSYATHRRYLPAFHFFVIPLLGINLISRIVFACRHAGGWMAWWDVIFAFGLLLLGLLARFMALRVQDRVIVLEETLRLERTLPPDLRARIGELRSRQLIALRFCDDAELPELTRAVLNGELGETGAIKKRIKNWRPDYRPRA